MADRIPLIVDSSSNQIKELPAGDSIILADNEKVNLGASSDLQLYHDSSHSYIKEAGTGDLRIDGDSVWLREADGTNQISAYQGTAKLYKDGTERLATTGSGLSIAGNIIYSGGSLTAEGTLSDGSTISWNASTDPIAKVTLAGNRTLDAPSNGLGSGQYISILVIQDGTGSRTLTWNAVYEFAADTAPTLTTTASKGDLFTFRYNGAKWIEVGRNLALTLS
tara:strand:+ start:2920 stop:3585 length:666 start_codon:yes stop_codon:yes gene_type:complete